jgi:hypothetical protein
MINAALAGPAQSSARAKAEKIKRARCGIVVILSAEMRVVGSEVVSSD